MRRATWPQAARAVWLAVVLLVALSLLAGNFVLVDVRLWGADVQTRLGWVLIVAIAAGFALGRAHAALVSAAPRPSRGRRRTGGRVAPRRLRPRGPRRAAPRAAGASRAGRST
jgi:hypothetical protein